MVMAACIDCLAMFVTSFSALQGVNNSTSCLFQTQYKLYNQIYHLHNNNKNEMPTIKTQESVNKLPQNLPCDLD